MRYRLVVVGAGAPAAGTVPPFAVRALASPGGRDRPLTLVLGLAPGGDVVAGPVRPFGWLLLVVVLTTPLQSAAEEYVFRGYLSQAIAGWVRRPVVGAVVAALLTAALFSAAHGPPELETFLDRFAVGLAASAVVWLTGGLEAAIVLHAVNNVLVFGIAMPSTSSTAPSGPTGSGSRLQRSGSGPAPAAS